MSLVKTINGVSVCPYKVYVAVLTQTGTSAPAATVLENTLGGTVVWTRVGLGAYAATLSNAFTSDKTAVFLSSFVGSQSNFGIISGIIQSTSEIRILTGDNIDTTLYDDELLNTSIEIRVYF